MAVESLEQKQTADTFGYKWSRVESYEKEGMWKLTKDWLMEKYFSGDEAQLRRLFRGSKKLILDAGCGSGFSASVLFGDLLNQHEYIGMDISDAAYVGQERFQRLGLKGRFIKANIADVGEYFPENYFDIIFSEGVLHCTDSTEGSIKLLIKHLKPGGHFLFYVYKKKAPIREFSDDYIREQLRHMNNEEAWNALYPLTKLGIALGELDVEVHVQEDVPLLGIKAGKYKLHKFIYDHICKMFYSPSMTLEEMNHINFDYYRPLISRRHTPEEIRQWCEEGGLEIQRLYVDDYGITVVGVKK